LEKLARGLISRTITIHERPKGGGRLDLKSMYEESKTFKRKAIIWIEIMIHFGFPKSTTNNQSHTRMKNDMLHLGLNLHC